MNSYIQIDNATLTFRIYKDKTPALKETVIGALSGKKRAESVIEFEALKNINITLNGGERVGVIGLNGAGKSTLLKMIVGIYPPQKGGVHVRGKVTPLIELGTGFDSELSGRENIYLNGALLGRSYKQMRALEQEIIDFSGLEEKIDMPIKYYSSGMYGRLAFSIATIAEPEILLIDEVFSTGDAQFLDKATKRMEQLMSNSHIVLLVSHSIEHIRLFCNRVIVLHKGQIVGDGPCEAMLQFYSREIVGVPIGPPATPAAPPREYSIWSRVRVRCQSCNGVGSVRRDRLNKSLVAQGSKNNKFTCPKVSQPPKVHRMSFAPPIENAWARNPANPNSNDIRLRAPMAGEAK